MRAFGQRPRLKRGGGDGPRRQLRALAHGSDAGRSGVGRPRQFARASQATSASPQRPAPGPARTWRPPAPKCRRGAWARASQVRAGPTARSGAVAAAERAPTARQSSEHMGQNLENGTHSPARIALVRAPAMSFFPTYQESRHLRRWLWRHRGEVVVGAACLATAAAVASALLLGGEKDHPVADADAADAGPDAAADDCCGAQRGSAPEAATAKGALASDSSSDSDPGAICEHAARLPRVRQTTAPSSLPSRPRAGRFLPRGPAPARRCPRGLVGSCRAGCGGAAGGARWPSSPERPARHFRSPPRSAWPRAGSAPGPAQPSRPLAPPGDPSGSPVLQATWAARSSR